MKPPPVEVRAGRDHPLGMPPARFLRDYWQKHPLLIRDAFPGFQPPLSPDELAGLACMDGALARIVLRGDGATAKGRWKVLTGPFEEATFAHLPEQDWTLLVQDVDKWDAGTAALLDHFGFIPSWRVDDVMISYAADGGGVGAHVDQYDVFLLQGLGRRRWSIDARPDPPAAFRKDAELKLLETFSPTHTWTLAPGDMLYLPPGVPHDGVAVGECTTFSVGMRAPAAGELLFDFAAHLAETLPESRRFADPDLKPAVHAGEIDDAALRRARQALGPLAAMLDRDAFADWFGAFVTRYRVAQGPAPRKRRVDRAKLAERLPHASLQRDPWSRFAWRRRGQGARLYVGGNVFDAPVGWASTLASGARRIEGRRLAQLPGRACGVALIASLIDAGHVTLRRR